MIRIGREGASGRLHCPGAASLSASFLLALAVSLACAIPAFADSKVGTVKVKFTLEGVASDGSPEIEAECDSERYSLDEFFTLEDYYEEVRHEDDDDNTYVNIDDLLAWNDTYRALGDYSGVFYAVRLEASDGYYFTKDLDKVKPSGLGAECVRLNRLDDRETLVIFVRFTELDAAAGTPEDLNWTENGWLTWNGSGGGAVYDLRLYRGGLLLAEKSTAGSRYDFRPLLREKGNYSCQVRCVFPSGEKSDWEEAGNLSVSEETAAENCALFPVETVLVGDTTRPGAEVRYLNTGWQREADGRYWYRETDGGYPQCDWREVGGLWYFFDRDGYLVTSEVVNWKNSYYYVNEEGRMLTGGRAPDGRVVQPDGTLLWPES